VEGELRAGSRDEDSLPFYVEAIEQARRAGATFVEGVASVALASARTRLGDVPGAADGFGYRIEEWRRTGQSTQLWTTARNAAGLLADLVPESETVTLRAELAQVGAQAVLDEAIRELRALAAAGRT
jgi:chorismate synthase